MKKICLIIALALAGCEKNPESSQQVNREFKVDTLFTKDGCTVYRFADGAYFRYFTNCKGSTSGVVSCGKNCTRPDEVSGGS